MEIKKWLKDQDWQESDHKYFAVFTFVCLTVYEILILGNQYKTFNIKDWWLIPLGLGVISFIFFLWSASKTK